MRARNRDGLHRFGRNEHGAAAVEFAIVFPVILLLTLGIIEFAFLLRDYTGVTSVVRESVRVASASPKQGLSGSEGLIRDSHAGTTSATGWSFAYKGSQVLATRGSAVPQSSILEMWVFLPNLAGFPSQSVTGWRTDTTSSFDGGCPTATCVKYGWDDSDGTFYYRSGLWKPSSINACAGSDAAMSVGVYMRVNHRSIVGSLIGTDMVVTDHAIARFEPMRNISCAASP